MTALASGEHKVHLMEKFEESDIIIAIGDTNQEMIGYPNRLH